MLSLNPRGYLYIFYYLTYNSVTKNTEVLLDLRNSVMTESYLTPSKYELNIFAIF